ncbi:MAG: cation:proton antiporter [SAR202 cluster bacterium]|nr:cation:proton antiporter [SAR202 cluster bacterium]
MDHDALIKLVFQLAIILVAAKVAGEICDRFLKMPAVLGELAAGIIIGPYALGGMDLPVVGALFPHLAEGGHEGFSIPVSEGLWSIAQVGSIVLLFMAGLETNLGQFLKYARPATIVAVGGVILPFIFGVALTMAFGYADSMTDGTALFMGAVMTATSVGITVRVLGDIKKLISPEGVTILGAAVLDDVIGILVLTVVVGISATGNISVTSVGWVAFKAFGFWLGLTGIGILLSKHISNLLGKFRSGGAQVSLALALGLLAAGMAETAGLAMIIGAFSIGLALSGTELAHKIDEPLRGIGALLVPVFFVVTGMLVDVSTMSGVVVFGLVITLFAAIGKLIGCGLPSLAVGFNTRGAMRIGAGMLPRGEVALIMAGVGITQGVLGQDLYGVAIMMTIITTAVAPPLLAVLFKSDVPRGKARDGGVKGEG